MSARAHPGKVKPISAFIVSKIENSTHQSIVHTLCFYRFYFADIDSQPKKLSYQSSPGHTDLTLLIIVPVAHGPILPFQPQALAETINTSLLAYTDTINNV